MSDECGCCCGRNPEMSPATFNICDRVPYTAQSIVSHTVVDGDAGTLTVFAFDEGEALSTHSAPFDAIVQVVDGVAEITIGGEAHTVSAGQMIVMPADMPHAVRAVERFKMILTMFRA